MDYYYRMYDMIVMNELGNEEVNEWRFGMRVINLWHKYFKY